MTISQEAQRSQHQPGENRREDQKQANKVATRQKYLQENLRKIVTKIREAENLETALSIVVNNIRESLAVERAIIYHFTHNDRGKVIAESVEDGWPPCIGKEIPAVSFGIAQKNDYGNQIATTIDCTEDENQKNSPKLTPYQKQLLEKFYVKSSLSLTITVQGKVWGLLVVQQCSLVRYWQEAEVNLLYLVGDKLSLRIHLAKLREQWQQVEAADKAVNEVIDRIRRSIDLDTIFTTTASEVRVFLGADRVAVYRFNPDWGGEFVAESVTSEWKPLVGTDYEVVKIKSGEKLNCRDRGAIYHNNKQNNFSEWTDTYIQETQGGQWSSNDAFVVEDIYNAGISKCYLQLLEKYQVKSYAIVPVFLGEKLWGMLAAYQNSGPRVWQKKEVQFLRQIAAQFSTAVEKAEAYERIKLQSERQALRLEQKQTIAKVIEKIRRSIDLETIFRTTTREVRQFLKVDRVAVFRFKPDWTGFFVAESVGNDWTPLVDRGELKLEPSSEKPQDCSDGGALIAIRNNKQTDLSVWADDYLQENQGGRFGRNEVFIVEDIYNADLSACHVEALEKYEIRAHALIPVFAGEKLWGILAAYQNTGPRVWQPEEVEFLQEIADQFGVASAQAKAFVELEYQKQQGLKQARQEQALGRVINRIRESMEVATIFKNTTEEVRSLLGADRVGIYRFDPEWTGRYVAESVGKGWIPMLGSQAPEGLDKWDDSYLQETKGGCFARGESYVVEDVHNAGLSAGHLEALDRYQVKSNAAVAILQGQKLWGILGVYQNSGPRKWLDTEVKFLEQIGSQLGVALQQAEYVEKIEKQARAITKVAEREKNFVQFLVKINQQIVEQSQQKLSLENLFKNSAKELRKLLKAERLIISRFNPDWSRVFICEEVSPNRTKWTGTEAALVEESDIKDNNRGPYREGKNLLIEDIEKVERSNFELEWLEQMGVKACAVVPIVKGERLWGLLGIYQNDSPRIWEQGEINLLAQASLQLGIAIQQSEYLERVNEQSQQLIDSAEKQKSAKELLQERATNLLIAVRPALSGDLTVRASVTDDEIGTIADAYNGTLQSLRKIVLQLQEASEKVAESTQGNVSLVDGLNDRTQQQFHKLKNALEQIQNILKSTQIASASTKKVEAAVQQANSTLEKGDNAMNQTVGNILKIRETVSETLNSIKRLSESSQKISKVVQVLGNFTSQTNLLAMNAALEATRAGEYGRGFAVVAEEVRSLSYQSSAATTEIEELIEEIQEETAQVLRAMETGLQEVALGTDLVGESRQNLNAIVEATKQISKLVHDITQVTRLQQHQAEALTKAMKDVGTISNQTTQYSTQMSASFQELIEYASQLQATATKFKVT
ncbi:MAG: GAF domain-containing protein [Prochloraceae cyanobacterium]|nr:GAF domain-containing protein [Prochloraceae cyanobacterium]